MDYGKLALKKIEELKDVIGDVNLSSLPRGGTVGLTAEDFIGVTRLSKSLDFYTNADGDLTLSMSGHLSGSAVIIFLLDGVKIFSRSASTGWVSDKITITRADKGEHSFKLLAAGGSEFDVTDIKMSAEGRIPASDGNYFLEAFPDGTGYIFRRFGTLEIFAQSGVSYVLIRSIGGVLYARTAGDDEKYIAAVTEKGVACLIDLASGYSSPGFYQICRGARAIAATEKEAG
ncbi:MAG: hypothetical protein J6U35_01625, partial [Clostridia bacterium]|nr:hypothetical protein [Clostridia bacterium]